MQYPLRLANHLQQHLALHHRFTVLMANWGSGALNLHRFSTTTMCCMSKSRNRNVKVSASSGTYGSSTSRSIALPPGVSPGAVIGKGGSNLKQLQALSGARLFLNNDSGRVEVSGSPAAVEEAVRLLQAQFEASKSTVVPDQYQYLLVCKGCTLLPPCAAHWKAVSVRTLSHTHIASGAGTGKHTRNCLPPCAGGAYPHPLQVHYLLDSSFGDTFSAAIGFEAAARAGGGCWMPITCIGQFRFDLAARLAIVQLSTESL